jgi:hypothetical protein
VHGDVCDDYLDDCGLECGCGGHGHDDDWNCGLE